jgi:hypothetical protein
MVHNTQNYGTMENIQDPSNSESDLRKFIVWDSRTTNNQKETKQILLRQYLFLFVIGGIATCFEPFLEPSSCVRKYY